MVEGKIENSIFRANKGDGIDFSGSTVISKNNVFEGIGDKAISVGEDSTFYAHHLLFFLVRELDPVLQ